MPPGGATFQAQRSILRKLWIPANMQTSWGTPVALAAMQAGEAPHYDVSGVASFLPMTESTYGQAGSGNSFASDNWQTGMKTKLDLSGFLTDWLAGFLFAMSLSKDTVTGAAAPYTHTINFLDTTTIAQGTTFACQDTADIFYQLVDMGITQLVITSTAAGALKFKASFIGTGAYVDGVLAAMPVPVTRNYLFGNNAQFSLGPTAGGAPASLFPRANSWELTIDTGVAEQRVPGGGMNAAYLSQTMPKVKLKAGIAASNVSDLRAWQLARVPLTMLIDIVSGAAELHFNFPNVLLVNCDLGDNNGNLEWTANFDETNILQVGNAPLLTATVKNSQASYLTAA